MQGLWRAVVAKLDSSLVPMKLRGQSSSVLGDRGVGTFPHREVPQFSVMLHHGFDKLGLVVLTVKVTTETGRKRGTRSGTRQQLSGSIEYLVMTNDHPLTICAATIPSADARESVRHVEIVRSLRPMPRDHATYTILSHACPRVLKHFKHQWTEGLT